MSSSDEAKQVVEHPTYMKDIRFYFTPRDVAHMAGLGIALGTYDDVKRRAVQIYFETKPPHGPMPPGDPWSAEQSETFENWIRDGCPLGAPPADGTPQPVADEARAAGGRLRKDVTSLNPDELEVLRKAFTGLMERDPSQPDSYFALAGVHGLPQQWCAHHVDPFNPWHRIYLNQFEDELRTVPGCEDVTLAYWDFTTSLPEVLQQPPFDAYRLTMDPGAGASPPVSDPDYKPPFTTRRFAPQQILQNMQLNGVIDDINTSLGQPRWGNYNTNGYQNFSIQAHDGGHDSIGPTMQDQNIASYDPVFWFFHANIDRLWMGWQTIVGATTLAGFESTVDDASWLSPPVNALPPLTMTSDESITLGISYDKLPVKPDEAQLENKVGSIEAARAFMIKPSSPVSVRVKGVNRLNIPGTFRVTLLADGEPLARRAFFQPKRPRDCGTCREQELINLDFRIDQDKLLGHKLSVVIDVAGQEDIGHFPLSQAGNPTINARLLLDEA
jgi:tyrosinase